MNVRITPSTVHGVISAPPSKSISHRAIIIASLARDESILENVLISDDTRYTIDALRALGVRIEKKGSTLTIEGTGGVLHAPKSEIFLGNSATTIRMMAAVAAVASGKTVLTGDKRLLERPMKDLLNALSKLGVKARSLNDNGCPPIEVHGESIIGNKIDIEGSISSQYITALLIISPFAKNGLTITASSLRSKPYVAVTMDVMNAFGVKVQNDNFRTFTVRLGQTYKGRRYVIEGDYSSTSYFFAAAALTGGAVTVDGLNPNSSQGDAHFLTILEKMGCTVARERNVITVQGPKELRAVDVDMGDYPDTVQTLAVVAAFAKGTTHIRNIAHLRFKETDRIEKPKAELAKMGIEVKSSGDDLVIVGGKPKGATIETYNDHRMAMSFAVAGLGARGETIIRNAEVVEKSYPTFFKDLKRIGQQVEELP